MNFRQLILSQPKLLAGGAAAALVVGLGSGLLAHAPIDAAFARSHAVAPNLTIDTSGAATAGQPSLDAPAPATTSQPVAVDAPTADSAAPRLVTAAVYPPGDASPPRPRAVRQDPAPVSRGEQWAAYDEAQAPRDDAEDRYQERAPDYPPPPPPPYGYGYDRSYGYGYRGGGDGYRGDDGPQ